MNIGTFEAMNENEMMAVSGGGKRIDTVATIASVGGAAYGLATATTPVGAAITVGATAAGSYAYACTYATYRTPANYKVTRRR